MECSLSLSLGKGSLSLPESCLSLGLESLLLNQSGLSLLLPDSGLSLSLSLSLLLRSEGCLSLSLGLSLLLNQSGLSLSLSILLGRGSSIHSRDHLGPEGGEDLGSDSGLVRGGHLGQNRLCALYTCTVYHHLGDQGVEADAGLGLQGGVHGGPDGGGEGDDDLLDQGLLLRLRHRDLGAEPSDLVTTELLLCNSHTHKSVTNLS